MLRFVALIFSYQLENTLFHNVDMSGFRFLREYCMIDIVLFLLKTHHYSPNFVMNMTPKERDLKEKLKLLVLIMEGSFL